MRGRRGGMLGVSPVAGGGGLSGLWRASEIYTLRSLGSWPRNYLSVDVFPAHDDATADWSAEFYAQVSSSYPSASLVWQKSVDDGQTWSQVQGQTTGVLTLSGSQRLANDGDLYRAVASAGMRVARSSPASVRFDTLTWQALTQPSGGIRNQGDGISVSFSALATGQQYGGSYWPNYQWQTRSSQSGNWTIVPGLVGTSQSFQVVFESYVEYRCAAYVGPSYHVDASIFFSNTAVFT